MSEKKPPEPVSNSTSDQESKDHVLRRMALYTAPALVATLFGQAKAGPIS